MNDKDEAFQTTLEEIFADSDYTPEPWWHDAIVVGIPLLGVVIVFFMALVAGS